MSWQFIALTPQPSLQPSFDLPAPIDCPYGARWDSRGAVRGVVQLAHGMGEHIGRYTAVIDALNSAGLVVYGNDHRGHGRKAVSPTNLGDFGEGGFDLLVEDMVRLSQIAREENPGKALLLIGHSMGSFASQQYVLDHSREIDGLILSGSGALDGLAGLANSAPAGKNILNAAFESARTPLDWLSSRQRGCGRIHQRPAVFSTTSACVLCIVFGSRTSTVRFRQSSQDTQRFAHLPVLRQPRSRWPAT